jgi:hypothetical protein
MTRDHRFAFLKGHCRKWLPEDYELGAEDSDAGPTERPVDGELARDAWLSHLSPARPERPLACLGDIISRHAPASPLAR